MKEALRTKVEEALRALLAAAGDHDPLPDFAIEVPRQKEHGDFSCNAAMLLGKRLGRKPREIAVELQSRRGDAGGLVTRAEVAGPGFLNVVLASTGWQDRIHEILEAGPHFGWTDGGWAEEGGAAGSAPGAARPHRLASGLTGRRAVALAVRWSRTGHRQTISSGGAA